MSKFKDLNKNMNDVLTSLISSQNLCKLLYYDVENPLDEADIEPSTLLFDKIFPIPKIPDAQKTQGSLLTVVFDDIRPTSKSKSYKNNCICFNVACHINNWMIVDALRPYSIMEEIDQLINQSRIVGIGKAELEGSRAIYYNDNFCGYRVQYKVTDFNINSENE